MSASKDLPARRASAAPASFGRPPVDRFAVAPRSFDYGEEDTVADQVEYRRNHNMWGTADLHLAAGVYAGSVVLAPIQEDAERQANLWKGLGNYVPTQSHDLVTRLVMAPLDWKAVALASSVYAVTSAAARMRDGARVNRDIAQISDYLAEENTQVKVYTAPELKRERIKTRLKRAALSAAGVVVSYKTGEHLPLAADMIAGATLGGGAMVSVHVAKAQAEGKLNKLAIRKAVKSRINKKAQERPLRRKPRHTPTRAEQFSDEHGLTQAEPAQLSKGDAVHGVFKHRR